jgi:hypothetical protein
MELRGIGGLWGLDKIFGIARMGIEARRKAELNMTVGFHISKRGRCETMIMHLTHHCYFEKMTAFGGSHESLRHL